MDLYYFYILVPINVNLRTPPKMGFEWIATHALKQMLGIKAQKEIITFNLMPFEPFCRSVYRIHITKLLAHINPCFVWISSLALLGEGSVGFTFPIKSSCFLLVSMAANQPKWLKRSERLVMSPSSLNPACLGAFAFYCMGYENKAYICEFYIC